MALALAAVVIAGLPNSRALPIAGIVSVLGAVGVNIWLRRRERSVATTDT